ncbi:MAG: hypothetical protein DMF67_16815 [Acidobacteria bacterium]|nr:MAG: hypothetical protein DMF66_00600 [Acidobacteriota bacterium]PYS81446.1 MAG: hypothetical protein DMF67_16815 [Acidobacteriota bacterium]
MLFAGASQFRRWATHMNASYHQRWLRTVIIVGVVYFIVNIAFAAFAGWSASNPMRVTWNRLGFLISAVAFAVHISYEHFRLGHSPRITAAHASAAVALGAFALAVAANVHGQWVSSSHPRLLVFALVAWPFLTAVPAFVVALVAAAGLGLRRRST